MSNARKLQTEIERCMKKVDEGVELFDEIWEKVYSAEQQNQKEKYEMDLKKEIKKLQRQRDQIKTWISSSEVKDKDPLIEARKLIESKMEQFKICEKETKTKTYSKEGLAREDKLDPEEEAKLNTTSWLGEYIDKFRAQVEEKDFEIERLSTGKTRKSHKAQLDALLQHVANHKYHISKLEGIIRLVNNDRLDVDIVDPLREDLDYYLDSYQDEEYVQAYDEDYFYESLGLDDLDIVNVDRVTTNNVSSSSVGGSNHNNSSVNGSKKSDDATSTSSRGSKDTKKSAKKSGMASVIPLTIGRARSKQEKTEKPAKAQQQNGEDDKTASSTNTTATAASAASTTNTTPSKIARAASGGNSTKAVLAPPAPTATQPPGTSMAAMLKRESEQQEKERQQKILREQQAKAQAAAAAAEQLRLQQQAQLAAQRQQEAARQQEALRLKQLADAQRQQQQQQQQQQEPKLRQQEEESAPVLLKVQPQQQHPPEQMVAATQQQQQVQTQQTQQQLQQQQIPQQQNIRPPATMPADAADPGPGTTIPAATGSSSTFGTQQTLPVASKTPPNQVLGQPPSNNNSAIGILTSGLGGLGLGGTGAANSRSINETNNGAASSSAVGGASAETNRLVAASGGATRPSATYVSSALSDSFAAVPHMADHERTTQYVPQNPYHSTPPSYPTTPSPILDKPEIFEKLGTDALFFVFYYAQGSYQQYLAARELKKQSWRFHKKYMTWFQRHEEPQITTEEYEQGTYVYFDYETGWCTRIKTDFRFEYSFLEDSLQ